MATPGAPTDQDPRNPHDLAVDVQQDLQKLATMLAHAGASPQAVSELTRMAEVMSQVVKVLGNGPQPGAAEAGPPQAPQAPQPAPQPQQPQAPAEKPPPAHQALHHATKALQSMVQQNAAQQQMPR